MEQNDSLMAILKCRSVFSSTVGPICPIAESYVKDLQGACHPNIKNKTKIIVLNS